MRRPPFLFLSLLAAGLCLTHASGRAAIEPPVLRASLDAEPLTLDWNGFRSSTDRYIVSFLMRGMLKYDAQAHPICDLCKSFQVSADGKVLRFELKPEEQWSDGVPLEAQHFVDSFRRLLNPANHFKAAGDFREIEGSQQQAGAWDPKRLAVRADGKTTLEISLLKPAAVFPHLLTTIASFPIRKELFKNAQDLGEHHAMTAVLGPYQLAAWEHGKRVVIEGNPKFTGPRPVYRVDFVLGPHSQQLAKFKSGKLDILSTPTSEDLMKAPGQKLQVNPYWATRSLVLNVQKKPVSDPGFRRALLYALDREALPGVLRNGERKVTGLIPPGLLGYRQLPLATADPARALKERTQAVPGGKLVELSLLVRDLDADRRVAEWISGQLEKIGVRLKTRVAPGGAYFNELEAGRFDLALTVMSFDIASPLEILRTFETGNALNRGHWTHVGFDALLGQLTREQDASAAASLVDQTTQLVEVKDIAVIPLGYPTQPFMLGKRVVSFAITPFGDPDLVKIQLTQ
jgi:ABC-type oligopeptide transport system substrate-binding subunit